MTPPARGSTPRMRTTSTTAGSSRAGEPGPYFEQIQPLVVRHASVVRGRSARGAGPCEVINLVRPEVLCGFCA